MKHPKVSILVPCFNEEKFIDAVVRNILDQDFEKKEMEVLFLDGNSSDKTPKIIQQHADNQHFIKLIPNPNQYVPHALNLGIQKAKGENIIIMGAHASYPRNYVSTLLQWLEKLDADNVGGVCLTLPRSNSLKAQAIAKVLAHPAGVGNSLFRIGVSEPKQVDTVPFGCYPKNIFEKNGMFDLRLIRNQDIELNKRIIRNGGKIFLVPEVQCTYYARDSFSSLWKNNYGNGKWVILTAWLTKALDSLSLRHFVPLGFFGYFLLAVFAMLKIGLNGFGWIYGIVLLPMLFYFFIILFFSIKISLEEKKIGLIPYLVSSFFTLHLSYGVGSFVGIFSSLTYSNET